MSGQAEFDTLKSAFSLPLGRAGGAADYEIVSSVGRAFVGRSRCGSPALLIPLAKAPIAPSRSGGGFTLTPSDRVAYEFSGRKWEQPSAALECTEHKLLDVFVVLCSDIISRLDILEGAADWAAITRWVDEWQALLGRKAPLTAEQELGLWGELWLIAQSLSPDELIIGWRGPEREHVDFFFDGIGVEVKTSRREHVHYVSQKQICDSVGDFEAYLLSLWVAPEPIRGVSLAELVDSVLSRTSDGLAFLKGLGGLGYSPYDRHQYQTRFVPLRLPKWFDARSVPRVRVADKGVSNVRYQIALNEDDSVEITAGAQLWNRLVGRVPLVELKQGSEK